MVVIKCWSSKIFICWVILKLSKWIDGSYCVLPDISDDVVKVACLEEVDRVRRHPVLQVDVPDLLVLPLRLVLWENTPQSVVLVLGWQAGVLSRLFCPPLAEGSGLEVVDFCRPVPGHADLLEESPQSVAVSLLPPEEGHLRLDGGDPLFAFLGPPFRVVVASCIYELKKLSIGDKHFTCLELRNVELFFSKFIVPSIGFGHLNFAFPFSLPSLDFTNFIFSYFLKWSLPNWTFNKILYFPYHLNWQPSNNDCRGFKVDSFMLYRQ